MEYRIYWEYVEPINFGELDPDPVEEQMKEMMEYSNELFIIPNNSPNKEYAKGITTQLGTIPINNQFNPLNLWTGHTNFLITSSIAEIIATHEGIEFFKVLTPYRFRIAIGKAWQQENLGPFVKIGLTKKVIEFMNRFRPQGV